MKPVLANDIIPFFKEKEVNQVCESCGKKTWKVHNGLEGLLYKRSDPLNEGMYAINVVFLQCAYCGFIRMYSRDAIVKEDREIEKVEEE